jgi:hypothetical protein
VLIKIAKKDIQKIQWQEAKRLLKTVTYARKSETDKFELSPLMSDVKEEKFTHLMTSLEDLSFEMKRDRSDKKLANALATPDRRVTLNLFDGRVIVLSSTDPSSDNEGLIAMDVSISLDPKSNKTAPGKVAEDMTRLSELTKKYFFLFPARVLSRN